MLRLRDELMAQGFTVWMDVDRMMGSTLRRWRSPLSRATPSSCASRTYKDEACRRREYAYTKETDDPGDAREELLRRRLSDHQSKLYYNMHTMDEMQASLPGLVGEVRKVQQTEGRGGAKARARAARAAGAVRRRAPEG